MRIQTIIAAAGESALGARDTRRLARHISHCQPCRRQAVAAGLDTAVLARKPLRRAVERAASFLPLPAFLRSRLAPEQLVPVSEPMAAAWSKAVAVAATVIVAGVGAGVAPRSDGSTPDLKPDRSKPAATTSGGSATAAAPAPRRAATEAAKQLRADRTSGTTLSVRRGLGSGRKAAKPTRRDRAEPDGRAQARRPAPSRRR